MSADLPACVLYGDRACPSCKEIIGNRAPLELGEKTTCAACGVILQVALVAVATDTTAYLQMIDATKEQRWRARCSSVGGSD